MQQEWHEGGTGGTSRSCAPVPRSRRLDAGHRARAGLCLTAAAAGAAMDTAEAAKAAVVAADAAVAAGPSLSDSTPPLHGGHQEQEDS